MNFSESVGNEVLLIGYINCTVGQKCDLSLIQVHIHELVGSLGHKCPSQHILSFRNGDFWKGFECASCCKFLLLGFIFYVECFLLIVLLWNFEVLDFLAQVIDWFLKGLCVAHLSGFLDVKSLFNGPQELGFNFDLYFYHFNFSANLLFNGKRYLLFAFFKCLNEGRYTNLLKDEFFFVVFRLGANFHNIYGKPFFTHGVDFDFVRHVLIEQGLLGGLHWIYNSD